MKDSEPYFVIPTHRLRDVGATVHEYDDHFRKNGHCVQMIVFDDSTQANVEKYLPQLEQIRTRSDLYYVGPREKEQFIEYINSRLRNGRLEPLVKNIFRPSYGGNRNFISCFPFWGWGLGLATRRFRIKSRPSTAIPQSFQGARLSC
jgi:hypothetical protein